MTISQILAFSILATVKSSDNGFYLVSTSTTERPNDEYCQKLEETNRRLTTQILGLLEDKTRINELLKKLEYKDEQISNILSFIDVQHEINNNVAVILNYLSNNLTACDCAPNKKFPKNCKEVMAEGHHTTGVYVIRPEFETLTVLCDMESKGGGWTVIQRRFDGSQNFDLNWNDYKKGFGSIEGEFWLGLERIHSLTTQNNSELLVQLVEKDEHKAYAYYRTFRIGSADKGYKLESLDGYEGDAGDSLRHHLNMKFSTKDRDQDIDDSLNCASKHGGGWWFYHCTTCNLNGRYLKGSAAKKANKYGRGINWYTFTTDNKSLLKAKMMVRPRGES